jgi:hypothetical protein
LASKESEGRWRFMWRDAPSLMWDSRFTSVNSTLLALSAHHTSLSRRASVGSFRTYSSTPHPPCYLQHAPKGKAATRNLDANNMQACEHERNTRLHAAKRKSWQKVGIAKCAGVSSGRQSRIAVRSHVGSGRSSIDLYWRLRELRWGVRFFCAHL